MVSMVPMAQRVAPSLPPQLVRGFLDKCFFLSAENTNMLEQISVENIKMLNGDVLRFVPARPASCLLSSLLSPLAGAGLPSCKVLKKHLSISKHYEAPQQEQSVFVKANEQLLPK